MVKISVIIPVYNSERFLRQCLESVCNQTLRDLEIICVNDASTDGSWLILQEYAKQDVRIKLINLLENKGAALARNIAIEIASGKYLGFVDSDDFVDLNFYERLYEKAVNSSAEVVKGNIALYCPKAKSKTEGSWIDINYNVKKHQAHFCFSFTSAIYQTSFIQENHIKFLEGLIHFEDPYFTIKAALFYKKLEVIDDVFYYYVNNPESASRKSLSLLHIDSMIIGVEKVLDELDKNCHDKMHYFIVFNFLVEQLLSWCNRIDIGDEITQRAAQSLFILQKRCRYKEEFAPYHFLQKKKRHKEEIVKHLRTKVKNDFKTS